ncbi:uncharacterized protein DUF4148 [Paraburkholderia eburnea]|uniref:Uncharacterized protein DUF4148 n=1 Tax=Paraburkholderia eburnea TaxID=1189126 RepID=A0A2S4MNR9_9BURK|nr:DUF4148 domain-containing protein [Paraburkholderia eburnea]POR55997.1 uncharacterized protein DUF4148 [Paraburkholderia eburnea]PRZ27124.1 uncharacterized protein DUF4148 [Paraburkholderia eburnea]
MNTLNTVRIAVACSAALFAGLALADSPSDQSQGAPSASQDVGGMPMTNSASGAPQSLTLTHAQVYQDLVRSEQSGERDRLNNDIYHGN